MGNYRVYLEESCEGDVVRGASSGCLGDLGKGRCACGEGGNTVHKEP